MKTNLLVAIRNIVNNPVIELPFNPNVSNNKITSVGEAFELYVKDVFCNAIDAGEKNEKDEIY